jgi:hypothetical protein
VNEPFAAGREADVFALDDGRVLRRYRTGADATGEAEVMAYAAGLGFPVPEVFRRTAPTWSWSASTGRPWRRP